MTKVANPQPTFGMNGKPIYPSLVAQCTTFEHIPEATRPIFSGERTEDGKHIYYQPWDRNACGVWDEKDRQFYSIQVWPNIRDQRIKNAASDLLEACKAVVREEERLRALAKQPSISPEFLQAWDAVCSLAATCKLAIAKTA